MYQRQYINVFDLDDTNQHTCVMTTLRKNLEKEMMLKNWNAYDLANKSGVPQPTIQRFLKGKIGDPRADTVRKLAKGLGTTEAALRGFEEIDAPVPLYENIEKLNEENRKLIEQMVNTLVQAQPELSQKPANKPLTAQPENVGAGVNLPDPIFAYMRSQNQAADQPFCDAVKRDIEDAQKKDAVIREDFGSTLT